MICQETREFDLVKAQTYYSSILPSHITPKALIEAIFRTNASSDNFIAVTMTIRVLCVQPVGMLECSHPPLAS